jgi:hypothetical protein
MPKETAITWDAPSCDPALLLSSLQKKEAANKVEENNDRWTYPFKDDSGWGGKKRLFEECSSRRPTSPFPLQRFNGMDWAAGEDDSVSSTHTTDSRENIFLSPSGFFDLPEETTEGDLQVDSDAVTQNFRRLLEGNGGTTGTPEDVPVDGSWVCFQEGTPDTYCSDPREVSTAIEDQPVDDATVNSAEQLAYVRDVVLRRSPSLDLLRSMLPACKQDDAKKQSEIVSCNGQVSRLSPAARTSARFGSWGSKSRPSRRVASDESPTIATEVHNEEKVLDHCVSRHFQATLQQRARSLDLTEGEDEGEAEFNSLCRKVALGLRSGRH